MKYQSSSFFLLVLVLVFGVGGCQNCNRVFNPSLWHGNKDFRYLIVQSLMDSGVMMEEDKAGIYKLLGEPRRNDEHFYAYYLGTPKGQIKFRETIYLIITFDGNNQVDKFYINADPSMKSSLQ